MGKTFDQLDAIDALADADLFVVDDDSGSDTNKMTAAQLITYIEAQQLDGLRLNEAVALAATSTEINNVCDGATATAAEINAAADGIGVSIPKRTLLDIGDWNMDSTTSVNVAHGLTSTKIRNVTAMIRADTGTPQYPLNRAEGSNDGTMAGFVQSIDSTNIVLTRVTNGYFDNNANFNATSYNRGWLVVDYID